MAQPVLRWNGHPENFTLAVKAWRKDWEVELGPTLPGKKRMLSDLRGLGVRIATQQDLDDAKNNYDPSNDYNEEIPPAAKRWRRQNLVHFDIDPQNSMS